MSPIVEGAPVERMGMRPSRSRKEVGPMKRPCLVLYSGC